MAINNAANIHIENTNSSLHYKHYITNITSHYKHYKLLTCLAAPLLGRRGEAAQSAVTREREEHADTGDLAAVDIGLQRSIILPPGKMQKPSAMCSKSPEDVGHVCEDGL